MGHYYSLVRKSDGFVVNRVRSEEPILETDDILAVNEDTFNLGKGEYYDIANASKIYPPNCSFLSTTGNINSGSLTVQLVSDDNLGDLDSSLINISAHTGISFALENIDINISSISRNSNTHSIILETGSDFGEISDDDSITLDLQRIFDNEGRGFIGFSFDV
jgi:hypothetical protein